MEKNEHAILLDIPSGGKNGKYHSAVLTTYAIDLIHFDNQLLNMLHRKQVCSINVLPIPIKWINLWNMYLLSI